MNIKIGENYQETVKRLEARIKEGDITVLQGKDLRLYELSEEDLEFQCYFCREPIKGKVRVLQEPDFPKGNETIVRYPIDSKCYAKAKGIGLVRNYIIFCEDDLFILKGACKGIKEKYPCYEIISSPSAEIALEEIAGSIPNLKLVFTDGQLGGSMYGWDLAEKLIQSGYGGPIVYIGGSKVPEDKSHLFTSYLPKQLRTLVDLKEDFQFAAQKFLE